MTPDDASAAPTRSAGVNERSRRRKLALLLLLLLLLAALGYASYYFLQNKRLPLPGTREVESIDPPQFKFSVTGKGRSALEKPTGVVISKDGKVFVTDVAMRHVRVYTLDGDHITTFSKIKDGKHSSLRAPVHAAVSPAGELFVSDRLLRAIYVFDASGRFLRKFLPNGDATFQWRPLALAFDDDGNLYVTDLGDTKNHRVRVFDRSGRSAATFGRTRLVGDSNAGPGEFYFPNGLVIHDGRVFVADGDNRRVQVFDKQGRFQYVIPTSGLPRGLALDQKKRLYVVDALAHQVDIYSLDGKKLATFGSGGAMPGEFSYPNDISLASDGHIYVADRENKQVQVWAYPAANLPTPALPQSPLAVLWCLPPLLLALIAWSLRRRPMLVTDDFVDKLIDSGEVALLTRGRIKWIVPEAEHPRYAGRLVDGLDLGQLLVPASYSDTDVRDVEERLEVPREVAILVAMARREKRLATESDELRALALMLGVDVYDVDAFRQRFARDRSR